MEEFQHSKENDQDTLVSEKTKRAQDYLLKVLGPYESYIVVLQRLLIWEIPWQSALLLISVNVLFWLSMTMSTYSLVGLVGIIVVCLDVWFSKIWPEIRGPRPNADEGWTSVDPHVYSVPEICQWGAQAWVYVSGWFMWLASLRLHQQGRAKFFLIMLFLFGSLLLVGQYISDTTIAYAAVMTVMLWPCILHHNLLQKTYEYLEPWLMKLEYTLKIRRRRQRKAHTEPHEEQIEDHAEIEDDSDLEEFVPSPDPVATAALARAITDSEDETPASSPENSQLLSLQGGSLISESDIHSDLDSSASFSHGIGPMPSIDTLDGSNIDWLRNQGLLPDSASQSLSFSPAHFNEGPSTLQEDYLTKDLSFGRDSDLTPEIEKGLLDSLDSETGAKELHDSAADNSVSTIMDNTNDSSDLDSQQFYTPLPAKHTTSQEKPASGLASTLTSVMTSDTVTSIMGNTVAGLSRIGEGAKAVASKIQEQAFSKGSPAGHSADETELTEAQIMEEFEFLDQEELHDYHDYGGSHNVDKKHAANP